MKALPTFGSVVLTLTVLGAGVAMTHSARAGPISVPIQGIWVAGANGSSDPIGPKIVLNIQGGDQCVQPGLVSGPFKLPAQNIGQTNN